MADDIFTLDDNNNAAIRTVSVNAGASETNSPIIFTTDENGNACVRVTGSGSGGDSHNKGYYATQAALEEAYPTAEAGDYAIVGSTDTVWVWDTDDSAWVDTDTKGQVTSVNGQTGAVTVSEVPSQTGYSGRVLGTDGFVAGWIVPERVQRSVMPVANEDEANNIYEYVGTTDANYTNGYFYKCVGTTTPSSATAAQTVGSTLSDIAVDLATLESFTGWTTDNSLQIFYTPDGWSVDTTSLGVTYTGTPNVGDAITITYTAAVTTYSWARVDVQPAPEALPDQTGQNGKFLTTDGTDASWSDKPLVNGSTNQYSVGIMNGTNSVAQPFNVFIGNNAQGYDAFCAHCVAIGSQARAANGGVAIGDSAQARASFAIQISTNTAPQYNSDANTFKVANQNGNFEIMSADGTVPTARLTHAINKYSSMPTAASTNEGWIVQYTGATDSTYTHGYIYECVSDGATPTPNYSWAAVEVQASSGGGLPSQTGNAGKFLTTDGTDASWSDKPLVNTAIGNGAIGIGSSLTVTQAKAVVLGTNNTVSPYGIAGDGSVVLGNNIRCGSYFSGVALVPEAMVETQFGAVVIGRYAGVNGDGSIAIGEMAHASAAYAIQLGGYSKTNSDANTFKVGNQNGNFEMMNANGNLPADRLASTSGLADGNYRLRLVMASGVPTLEWVAE